MEFTQLDEGSPVSVYMQEVTGDCDVFSLQFIALFTVNKSKIWMCVSFLLLDLYSHFLQHVPPLAVLIHDIFLFPSSDLMGKNKGQASGKPKCHLYKWSELSWRTCMACICRQISLILSPRIEEISFSFHPHPPSPGNTGFLKSRVEAVHPAAQLSLQCDQFLLPRVTRQVAVSETVERSSNVSLTAFPANGNK